MGGLGVLCQDPVSCCKKTEILYFYTIHTQYKKAAVMHVRDLGGTYIYALFSIYVYCCLLLSPLAQSFLRQRFYGVENLWFHYSAREL